jgi:TetR/AcrR family transcriptional regulator, transcriptional repressor for nem operon
VVPDGGEIVARHKEFAPDAVLEQAMNLFWEQGYEKTSMLDLVARMGIHKRSMYDTFGDKRALFLKALDRYIATSEAAQLAVVDDASVSVCTILRRLFESSIADDSTPAGCLAVNSATELIGQDAEVASRLERHFNMLHQLLVDLIGQGRQTGELPAARPVLVLADALHSAWIGLRVQARAGVERAQLQRTVDGMLELLG